MQQHEQQYQEEEQNHSSGRRKWKNFFRRRENDRSDIQPSDSCNDDVSNGSLIKSPSTKSIDELSDATSVTSTASSFQSSYSPYSGERGLGRRSKKASGGDKPIAPAARRPSGEGSISSFYLGTDDEDSCYNGSVMNEQQMSSSSYTWTPAPPSNVDVSKYEYGDASPDHTGDHDGSDMEDSSSTLGYGNSHHSRSSVDSTPKVPSRRRRSSIHFGQEDNSATLTTTATRQDSQRGHEYVGQQEAEDLVAASTPPQAPRRRASVVRRRNYRASISFGGEFEESTPVFRPPSNAASSMSNNNVVDSSNSNINVQNPTNSTPGRTARRSSMKQLGTPRRASIQFAGEIEVNLPGRSNPVRRRTSITFASEQDVKEVTPSCNLTNEPERLWYRRNELKDIRIKNHTLIHSAETGEQTTRKKCLRGLEDMMESSREREERQRQAVDGVLTLQHLQRNTGDYDDEYLSRLYQFSSKSSGQIAAERGAQDAEAVTKYLAPTRKQECRRLSMF